MTIATDQQQIPTLTSERLLLRGMTLADAQDVQRLAGDRGIAATTALIPHPYPDGAAEQWIATHQPEFAAGKNATWAITLPQHPSLIGAVGLIFNQECDRAEIGYWIGAEYWSNGYMTEAAAVVLRYGFLQRNLKRIFAHHFHTNPASGKVMEKLGMKREGVLRSHYKKWGEYVDCVYYGILREEYVSQHT